MTDDQSILADVIRRALDRLDAAVRQRLKAVAIDEREHRVLAELARVGPRSQRELGRALGIDRTTMVALIDRLEHLRLVRRGERADDRRVYEVGLRPAGKRRLAAAAAAIAESERDFLATLEPHARARFRRSVRRLGNESDWK